MNNLKRVGLTPEREKEYNKIKTNQTTLGRVIAQFEKWYTVVTEQGEIQAQTSGNFIHKQTSNASFPAIGDWVCMEEVQHSFRILSLLKRTTKLSRKSAGHHTKEQVIVANADVIYIVFSLDQPFNFKKYERFYTAAAGGGATVKLILNKCDTHSPKEKLCKTLNKQNIQFFITSTLSQEGIPKLIDTMEPYKTHLLVGPSGVGKSSLINALMGENIQKVLEVREKDKKGKHTTTHRELFILPNGSLLIDTPGIRELSLWDQQKGLEKVFDDITTLAQGCKFNNCEHINEPECAVKEALENQTLNEERYISYIKMKEELEKVAKKKKKFEKGYKSKRP